MLVVVMRNGVEYTLPPLVVDPEDVGLISAMQAVKSIEHGATAFLAVLTEVQASPDPPAPDPFDSAVADMPLPACKGSAAAQVRQVLLKHRGVFSKVTGLPPLRGVEHEILLQPGAKPPFGPIYQLSPFELEECKQQLAELIEKDFIQPSKSPYGAPILLCARRMVSCACVLTIGHSTSSPSKTGTLCLALMNCWTGCMVLLSIRGWTWIVHTTRYALRSKTSLRLHLGPGMVTMSGRCCLLVSPMPLPLFSLSCIMCCIHTWTVLSLCTWTTFWFTLLLRLSMRTIWTWCLAATATTTGEDRPMKIEDMILVSVDDHVVEPPDLFERHLPAKYEDVAPKRRPQGRRHRRLGVPRASRSRTSGSTRSPAGRPRSTASSRPRFDEMRPGCYDIDERIRDMNANGVLGSLNFPSLPGLRRPALRARSTTRTPRSRSSQAYNDWHIDEWCGTYPGRFIPLRGPADLGPRADGRRGAPRRRRRAATRSRSPRTRRRSACRACTPTTGTRSGRRAPTRARSSACTSARRRKLVMTAADAPIDVMITLQPMNIVQAAADLICSPVLHEVPRRARSRCPRAGSAGSRTSSSASTTRYSTHNAWTGADFGGEAAERGVPGARRHCASSTTPSA